MQQVVSQRAPSFDQYKWQHRQSGVKDFITVSRLILLGYPELSDGAKLTFCVIYDHDWFEPSRGGRKGFVYPTVARLATLRHTSVRTIQRHLAELVEAGLLTRVLRPGKPNMLYIETPTDRAKETEEPTLPMRGDSFVRGGVTKTSPYKTEKEKQTKAVNAGKLAIMEKGRAKSSGWVSLKTLLSSKQMVPAISGREQFLTEEMVDATGDERSFACYRVIADRCPADLVFEAISLLKDARRQGLIRQSRGALFVGIIRRLCQERKLADPLSSVHRLAEASVGERPSDTPGQRLSMSSPRGSPARFDAAPE